MNDTHRPAITRSNLTANEVDNYIVLLDSLGHEVEEPPGVLIWVACADTIDIRPILHGLGRLCSLLFNSVVGQHIDDGNEVDFSDRRRIATRYGIDVKFWNYATWKKRKKT